MENKTPYHFKEKITQDDIMQLREWKNVLVERKAYTLKGTALNIVLSDELIRVVNFLNTLTVEKID